MQKVLLMVFMALALPVFADNCEKLRDDFDGLYCLNKNYMEADNEMNAAYNELRATLTTEQRGELTNVQLKWIKERNAACGLKKDGKFYVSLGCTTAMTVAQTGFLQARLKECSTATCFTPHGQTKPNISLAALPDAGTTPAAAPEINTIIYSGPLKITDIRGSIMRKNSVGDLVPVAEGETVANNSVLLVRIGSTFRINGSEQMTPNNAMERWFKVQRE